jgi:hypothetical protein
MDWTTAIPPFRQTAAKGWGTGQVPSRQADRAPELQFFFGREVRFTRSTHLACVDFNLIFRKIETNSPILGNLPGLLNPQICETRNTERLQATPYRSPEVRTLSSVESAFARRVNPDGTTDSICRKCFVTVGSSTWEAELERAERIHRCDPYRLVYLYKTAKEGQNSD